MNNTPITIILMLAATTLALRALPATEFHVAITGSDARPGTQAAPLRTIQRAAELAQPGDTVTVHAGTYREYVNPPRGGESDTKRIVYQAAAGEKVVITGSEEVKNWENIQDGVWKATISNTFFGGFNPFAELISGDWFDDQGRNHHTGAVYLNGEWLAEAVSLEEVMKPMTATPLWSASVDATNTVIWAQFKGVDPNTQQVEVNARQIVFYPDKPGRNFITVRGFTLRNATTPWAPPTVEQIGLIGVNWSKGWIIEDNDISYSRCAGISLGKYGDAKDINEGWAEGYVQCIERALQNGWNKETIGHHMVRNNHISHCGQAGIVGSLGAVFSTVTGNTIHDIHVRQQAIYNEARLPMWMDGNVFFQGATPSKHEKDPILRSGSDPALALVEKNDGFYLTMTLATALGSERPSQPVTSARLGKSTISGCAFENPDGSLITIGTDYFDKPRNAANPTPGPFEAPGTGTLTMKVWPLASTRETK